MNWKEKLAQKRSESKMVVDACGLDKIGGGWGMAADQSAYKRADGKFFHVEGAMIHSAGHEVAGWGQPLMREQGPGVLVLLTDGDNFLATMRQEPGNPAAKQYILLGPPLQASLGNMQQAHGGKRPPRAEFYDNEYVVWVDAYKDGGRFIESMNRIGILRLSSLSCFALLPDEIILSRSELKDAFFAGELNSHMREMMGMALL